MSEQKTAPTRTSYAKENSKLSQQFIRRNAKYSRAHVLEHTTFKARNNELEYIIFYILLCVITVKVPFICHLSPS